MNKENETVGEEERGVRITRARAKAMGLGMVSTSSKPFCKKELKKVVALGPSSKREASALVSVTADNKKRAVLADVTNVGTKSQDKSLKAENFQARGNNKKRKIKVASDVSVQGLSTEDVATATKVESHDCTIAERMEAREPLQPCISNVMRDCVMADPLLFSMKDSVVKFDELMSSPSIDIDIICEKLRASDGLGILDIDSGLKDLQVWSSYAPDIYNNIHVRERDRRPLSNYMDKLQQDITPTMRGILVNWLVEVSEEYKLAPDTLYLTVNLIDRVLSTSVIQMKKLQLLGVTCMLISSKYEEICAPRVEEFCFITDNTYTKSEVLKMEVEVLNVLHFQLSVPTTITFLRRFIQAACFSYKVPHVEFKFLANYLAELSLVEYSFLQFLPSLIAASAVFLAGWTLNQSQHPWNPTLEHCTNYKTSELKTTVLALADLQLNTKGCSLNAIREKYTQSEYKCVANLSPKPVEPLFQVKSLKD